jgi:hypothetical protein
VHEDLQHNTGANACLLMLAGMLLLFLLAVV